MLEGYGIFIYLLPEGYVPPERDESVELELCKQYIKSCHNPSVKYTSPQRRIEELETQLKDYTTWKDKPDSNGDWLWATFFECGCCIDQHDIVFIINFEDYSIHKTKYGLLKWRKL